MINKLLGTLLLLLVSYSFSFSQNIPIDPDRARIELERRGLDEDQVRQKLLEKGIDINNIDPSQIGEVEQALEEAIRELEEENQRAASQTANEITNEATRAIQEEISDVAKEATEEINESVEEGKPLDQAISEEIIDAQLDPPASGVYGQQIFRDKSIGVFSKSVDALPPDSYVIGPGDRVTISIWGLSQEDATYKVQDGGYIKPSGMPRINLQGITYESAKRLLESRYSQYYRFRPEEFEMTITYSRNINVNIYGEVFNPGTFNLPATNTAFNSLVAAGGPSNIGSVRNIRLIRGGEVKEIDVYDFMMDPTVREKFYLQDNDIIHVGVADRLIRISGAVKRPFVYELKKDENLVQLIEYAGGLRDNAYQSNIQVKRYVDDLEKIIDVDLRTILAEGKDFILESGDEVLINNIPKPYKNFVEISGAAELPARYELTDSMRILDLLAKGQPSEDARTDIAFLIRTNPDQTINYERLNLDLAQSQPEGINNPVLQPKDRLFLLSKVNYVDIATFTINGAVRKPSEYSYDPRQSLRIEDAIILAGGLRPDATNFAYISRVDPSNTDNIEYIRVQLDKAMQDPNSGNNLYLQANDVLYIYSNLLYTDEFFVSVQGAVRQPGKFQYDESLTLRDLLTMAGGLKLEAATSRVDISRLIIRDNEPTKTIVATVEVEEDLSVSSSQGNALSLQPFDQVIVRTVPEFEPQQNVVISGEVSYPGLYPLIDDNEKLWSIVLRAGGLTSEAFPQGATLLRKEDGIGYVILDLESVIKDKTSTSNLILKTGDVITIPKRKDLVTIKIGNTMAAELYPDKVLSGGRFNVPFKSGLNAKQYVNKYAAGISKNGRRKLITVEHPNGEIKKTVNLGIVKIYPKVREGSVITVGKKPPKEKKEDKGKEGESSVDWGRTIADSIAQATAVLSLILLLQQVNN